MQTKLVNNDSNLSISNSELKVTCSVYSSFEDIAGLREEWDSFVESVNGDIYLTYDWCLVWWKFYGKGRSLQLFLFYHREKIIGIIPMFFETIRLVFFSIRVGKIVGADFTLSQFGIPIHPQFIDPCVKSFIDTVKSIDWHVIILGPLSGLSANTIPLNEALSRFSSKSKQVTFEEGMVQTYFALQPTWEKYLTSLKKSQRRLILRKYSALQKIQIDGIKGIEAIVADKENLTSFFNGFVDLHQSHWHGLGKLGHFGDWPSAYSFHYEMANSQLMHDRLRLMCIRFDNEVLGFEYAYKFGDKYYAILNARTENEIYSKIGTGPVVFSEQTKMAIDEKVAYIDAMRGRYEYKLMLGGQLVSIKKIIISDKNFTNFYRVKIFNYLIKLIDFFYYRIWFIRLAPKLPFKRKPLWNLWIRTRL
jgi:CelD/BcsL family acetyltransferase involved in cellulose biosynthesis